MGYDRKGTLVRMLTPLFLGPTLGAAGAVVFAILCAALYWAISGGNDLTMPLVIRLGAAGAVAGAVMGLCRTIDLARE
jgi:hypothetical protein